MLDTKLEKQLAEATADFFSWYAGTGTQLARASGDRCMELWIRTMQIAARRADARWDAWCGAFQPWMDLSASIAADAMGAAPEEDEGQDTHALEAAYASYRTAGGHATAQIIPPGGHLPAAGASSKRLTH